MPNTERRPWTLIVCLGFLNALTPFSIDLYLPAFAQIAPDLGTNVQRMALTVSVYFIGFALGQVIYGPLLDRYGRKPPLYFGLALYIAASIGCMSAHTVEQLMFFRILSALGGSATSVGATAMVRDYYPPKDSARMFSMLMLVLSVSPLLAPTIGSLMVGFVGWRALFGVLCGMALVDAAIVALALPRVYEPDPSVRLTPGPILRGFLEVLKNRQFLVYTLSGSFAFAGLFVYVAGSPAIYMDGFGLGPRAYGAVFATLAMGMIGGSQLNHWLVRKTDSQTVYRVVLSIQTVVGLVFFTTTILGMLGVVSTTVFLFVLLSCAGIGSPNTAALALEPFTKNIGSASSMMGFLRLGLGAVVASTVGLLDTRGALPTAATIAGASVIAWVILWRGAKRS